jgi:hypothetical protein
MAFALSLLPAAVISACINPETITNSHSRDSTTDRCLVLRDCVFENVQDLGPHDQRFIIPFVFDAEVRWWVLSLVFPVRHWAVLCR